MPVIQSREGHHLGFTADYAWTDSTGRSHAHSGNRYQTYDEALASTTQVKPATWASWAATVRPCSTYFHGAAVVRSHKPMAVLIREASVMQELAA